MLKRLLIATSLAVALMLCAQPLQRVHGILMTDAELLTLNTGDATASNNEQKQVRENSLVHALKAPFKAIGRLFGRGRKGDNRLQRLSEKDISNFESTPVDQIKDATVAKANVSADTIDGVKISATDQLENGRNLLNTGHLNEAITELSRAASMDPKLAEAHNLLGVAYQMKGLNDRARQSFEAALKIDKKNLQTLNNLGYLLLSTGDYKGASSFLKKAARLAPDDPRVLNNLALAQSLLGKFDEATKNFVRAGGEIKGRINAANQLQLAGRSEDAQKQYETAKLRAEAEQKADPRSQAITVIVGVKGGRVTYASVSNRRPGMEAFESSAIRLARQRRYPLTMNGQESVVVRVNPLPAS
ncbi:MAG: tetratricopeptide repeat protein [Pyrinomonadaceae bacterium]